MILILLSYDQAILVFKLIKTNQSRRSIVTFVAFITGISAIGVVKLAFAKPISTQHRRGERQMGLAISSIINRHSRIQELVGRLAWGAECGKPEHRLAGVAAHIAASVIQRCKGLRMDVAPLIAPAQREPARGLERSNRRCQMWTSDNRDWRRIRR